MTGHRWLEAGLGVALTLSQTSASPGPLEHTLCWWTLGTCPGCVASGACVPPPTFCRRPRLLEHQVLKGAGAEPGVWASPAAELG